MHRLAKAAAVAYRFWILEIFVLIQVVIAHFFIYNRGFHIGGLPAIADSFRGIGWPLLLQFLVGVLARAGWAYWKRDKTYLAVIRSPEWLIGSFRLLIVSVLVVHVYGWLKLMLPFLNRRWMDSQLWELDARLLGGYSPNVLLLEALANPAFLRTIDVLYHTAFVFTLLLSVAIFLSDARPWIRISFAAGSAFLWIAGAWLYVSFPSMGPAYAYAQVWDAFWDVLPRTKSLQKRLLLNFQYVLELRSGVLDPRLNFVFGIAAFPSLHVAFQTYVTLWIRYLNRYAGLFMMVGVAVMFVGSIVTGWHYMIDSIAGVVLGILAYGCAKIVRRRLESPAAAAGAVQPRD